MSDSPVLRPSATGRNIGAGLEAQHHGLRDALSDPGNTRADLQGGQAGEGRPGTTERGRRRDAQANDDTGAAAHVDGWTWNG